MEKLTETLNALANYTYGSGRAALRPIDEAANAVWGKPAEQAHLEEQLLAALEQARSTPARQYACLILARVGSKKAVPVLAGLLPDAAVSSSARTALEAIPSDEASKALRKALSKTGGATKVGIINSLGVRHDESAVGVLAGLGADPDPSIAAAAVAALGEIGTRKAAQALMRIASAPGRAAVPSLADAVLTCAERLREVEPAEARRLLAALAKTDQPQFVRDAVARASQMMS